MNSNVSGVAQAPQYTNVQVPNHNQPKKVKNNKSLVIVLSILVLLLVASLGYTGYLLYEKDNLDPIAAADEELDKVMEQIGNHLLLPEDKDAELGTVLDIEALKVEYPEFYKNAKNGDKLLFYPDRAILYDPDRDIILNIAPIIDPNVLDQPVVDEAEELESVDEIVEETIEDEVTEEAVE